MSHTEHNTEQKIRPHTIMYHSYTSTGMKENNTHILVLVSEIIVPKVARETIPIEQNSQDILKRSLMSVLCLFGLSTDPFLHCSM